MQKGTMNTETFLNQVAKFAHYKDKDFADWDDMPAHVQIAVRSLIASLDVNLKACAQGFNENDRVTSFKYIDQFGNIND